MSRRLFKDSQLYTDTAITIALKTLSSKLRVISFLFHTFFNHIKGADALPHFALTSVHYVGKIQNLDDLVILKFFSAMHVYFNRLLNTNLLFCLKSSEAIVFIPTK